MMVTVLLVALAFAGFGVLFIGIGIGMARGQSRFTARAARGDGDRHGPAGSLGRQHGLRVGVRLNPGAPLPPGARAIVRDPRSPGTVAPDMRTAVPARFDRGRLEAAVAAHGGHVVEINAN